MAKILIINLPVRGHVKPTIALTRELVLRGHEITYLITKGFQEKIAATGAKVICYDNNTSGSNDIFSIVRFTKAAYKRAVEIGEDYDFIFYESIFCLGEKVGKILRKPTVQLHSVFALNKKIAASILVSFGFPFTLAKGKNRRRFFTKLLLRKGMVKNDDIIDEITENTAVFNIVYTSRKFQPRSDEFDGKKYKFVGPYSVEQNLNVDIPLDKLEGKLILISMGTTSIPSSDFFKKCIKSFMGFDATVIISVGEDININNLSYGIGNLGGIPDNLIIYPCVPQLEILQRADLFITHGGMNSANEAIYYGVPVIVIPEGVEQIRVANRIVELGLGEKLDMKNITSKALCNKATAVLENPSYKKAMNLMSADMKTLGGYERAADEIEKYIQTKLGR